MFKDFKQSVLDCAHSSNFHKFSSLMTEYPSFANNWQELRTKGGDTVVHLAAQSGCVDIIKYYYELGNKAILEQKNLDGKTPLHTAAQSSQFQIVKYLLSCNVSVDALKRSDWSPLMLASTRNNLEIIKLLIQHGANLNVVNKDGWTAFHIAAREGHVKIIKYFLDYDPFIWNTTSKNGRTPLHTASLHGNTDTVKVLLNETNCNKYVKDSCGRTPLMDAISGHSNDVIQIFINQGIELFEVLDTDKLGRNGLHLAAEAGNLFCIERFVKTFDVPVNCYTVHGLTPLHLACKENNLESVNLLISLGANYNVTDKQGRTALEYTTDEEIRNRLQNLKK